MTNNNEEKTKNLLSFAEPTAESNMLTVSKSVVEVCTKEDPNLIRTRRRETLICCWKVTVIHMALHLRTC